jgi:zinc-binding alcohol dehydrogenase/oxidoreductase
MGAAGTANYRELSWDQQLRSTAGVFDVIFDSAGGPDFTKLLGLAAPGGRIVFCGATAGDPPVFPMRVAFWKQLTVLGSTMGSPRDFMEMLEFVARYSIEPSVSHVVALQEIADAFALMEESRQLGKIVIAVRDAA